MSKFQGKDAAPGAVLQDTSSLHKRESERAIEEQAAHKARVSSLEPSVLPPHPGAPPAVRKPPVPVPPVKAPAKSAVVIEKKK